MKKFNSTKFTLFNTHLPCTVGRGTCYCGRYLLCWQTSGTRPYTYQHPVIFDDKTSTHQRDETTIRSIPQTDHSTILYQDTFNVRQSEHRPTTLTSSTTRSFFRRPSVLGNHNDGTAAVTW